MDTNAECVGMLHETQEEIKELRSKNTPSAGLRRHLPYGLYPMVRNVTHRRENCCRQESGCNRHFVVQDSLAAEIEGSMRRGVSVEEEIAFDDQR